MEGYAVMSKAVRQCGGGGDGSDTGLRTGIANSPNGYSGMMCRISRSSSG